MLLGYKEETGEIEFLFSDSAYLEKKFPKNTAKITNFWKITNYGLKEYFTNSKQFPDFHNYKNYKIIDEKIIKKTTMEIAEMEKPKKRIQIKEIKTDAIPTSMGSTTPISYIKSLEERIKKLEEKIK